MSLWESIIGHEWAVQSLRAAIKEGRIGHAYLITGPDQIGKTTLVLTFAQAINCTTPDVRDRPCGQCRSCHLISVERHPDLKVLSGETSSRGSKTIKIDQIRQLQKDLNLSASEARYKVAIVEQFENANQSAANAFLKTLEEPPQHVIIVLTASDADMLLPTVSSRCRVIILRPLSVGQVTRALEEQYQIPSKEATFLAHLSRGRMGWAVQVIREPKLLTEREQQMKILQELLSQSRVERFALAETLARNPEELPFILRSWISWWRDALLLAYGQIGTDAITNIDQLSILESYVSNWPLPAIIGSLKQTDSALIQLRQNANVRLVIENLLLGYPQKSVTQPVDIPFNH